MPNKISVMLVYYSMSVSCVTGFYNHVYRSDAENSMSACLTGIISFGPDWHKTFLLHILLFGLARRGGIEVAG